MLNLNETITAYDLAEALSDESGKFEVTTPSGEQFVVTSKPGHSISTLRPVAPQREPAGLAHPEGGRTAELPRERQVASFWARASLAATSGTLAHLRRKGQRRNRNPGVDLTLKRKSYVNGHWQW